MGKASKRSEDQLRTEARARVEDLPGETAAGRLVGGEEQMPQPEQQRRAARTEQQRREERAD
jgi:hypothetical protein